MPDVEASRKRQISGRAVPRSLRPKMRRSSNSCSRRWLATGAIRLICDEHATTTAGSAVTAFRIFACANFYPPFPAAWMRRRGWSRSDSKCLARHDSSSLHRIAHCHLGAARQIERAFRPRKIKGFRNVGYPTYPGFPAVAAISSQRSVAWSTRS